MRVMVIRAKYKCLGESMANEVKDWCLVHEGSENGDNCGHKKKLWD